MEDTPGNEDTTAWANSRREDFPDEKFTVDMIVAEGDTVAAYLSWSGTQQDDDEDDGRTEHRQACRVGLLRLRSSSSAARSPMCGGSRTIWVGSRTWVSSPTRSSQSAEAVATPAA